VASRTEKYICPSVSKDYVIWPFRRDRESSKAKVPTSDLTDVKELAVRLARLEIRLYSEISEQNTVISKHLEVLAKRNKQRMVREDQADSKVEIHLNPGDPYDLDGGR